MPKGFHADTQDMYAMTLFVSLWQPFWDLKRFLRIFVQDFVSVEELNICLMCLTLFESFQNDGMSWCAAVFFSVFGKVRFPPTSDCRSSVTSPIAAQRRFGRKRSKPVRKGVFRRLLAHCMILGFNILLDLDPETHVRICFQGLCMLPAPGAVVGANCCCCCWGAHCCVP